MPSSTRAAFERTAQGIKMMRALGTLTVFHVTGKARQGGYADESYIGFIKGGEEMGHCTSIS